MSLFLFLLCFCIMRDTLKVFHLRDGRVDSILDTLYNLSEEKEAFFITQKMKKLFSVKLGKSKVILIAAIILLGGTGTAYGPVCSPGSAQQNNSCNKNNLAFTKLYGKQFFHFLCDEKRLLLLGEII